MIQNAIGMLAGIAVISVITASAGHCETETKWVLKPNAVQTCYKQGVPHTDRNGKNMDSYDASKSFFPLCLYHASYKNLGNGLRGLSDIAKAGFNAVHLCWGQSPVDAEKDAIKAGVQFVVKSPNDAEVSKMKDSPAMLAWYLNEEPTMYFGTPRIQEEYDSFLKRRAEIRAVDPKHPVFLLDGWWFCGDEVQPWWVKLNTAGDITCHDNYPISFDPTWAHGSISSKWGIPESVSLAVSSVKEQKPMWLCVQSHHFGVPKNGSEMPSTAQERCMVYTAIVHGATGIIYFGLDSIILRQGACIGIAPDPKSVYEGQSATDIVATQQQLRGSRDLWNQVVEINKEIAELRPAILSPTASVPYEVYVDPDWSFVSADPIRTILKTDPAGGYVLLLVNVDSTAQRVRVRFPDMAFTAKELFQSPGLIRQKGDEFMLYSPGYDARAIHIDRK